MANDNEKKLTKPNSFVGWFDGALLIQSIRFEIKEVKKEIRPLIKVT